MLLLSKRSLEDLIQEVVSIYCYILCRRFGNRSPFLAMSDMAEEKAPVICSLQSLDIQLNEEIRRHLSDHYGGAEEDTLELILTAMKRPPAFTTCRVNLIKATRKEVLEQLQSFLSAFPQLQVVEDSDFQDVIHIFPTTKSQSIKNGTFDKSSLSDLTGPLSDDETTIAATTTTTTAQDIPEKDLFPNWPSRRKEGWPISHRCIVCDRFCGEAVLRGSDIFVMGVMAADANIRENEKVAVYADIPSPENTEKLLRGMKLERYKGKCVYLGLGTTALARNEIFRKTQGVAITMSMNASERVGPPLPPLYGVLSDQMMLQNLPSILVGHALNPQPNDTILDMCSAPGGKTSHLASLVNNQAFIVACDKSKKKVASEKELFGRMGATCITPLALDATNCCIENEERKDVQHLLRDAPVGKTGLKQIKKFYKESFDKILLDPPCSALGLRPKLFVAQDSLKELQKHAEYQRKFVNQAVRLLKVGGIMTYSTCTINGDENEGMVRHILSEYPCMELLPINVPSSWREKRLGSPGLEGFGLSPEERNCLCRFDPSSAGDTMGFFVTLFRKRSSI